METGFIALGILSILYYVTLLCYTKRWNSTFTWFWMLFGALNVGLGVLVGVMPTWCERILTGMTTVLWILFFAVEVLILCAMVSVVPKGLKYVIILGAQVRGTSVTESLKRRLDRGVRYLKENPETIVIVSGGQGKGEDISEARAMADYLFEAGIEPERIVREEKSTSTYENFENSRMFLKNEKKDKVGIITNNFHIYRAMKLARLTGYQKVYAIPASSNPVVFPNYIVREFFAVTHLFLKQRKRKEKSV